MIAASARTSGTSRPNSSTRKRGVCSSFSSRARAAARALAKFARRVRAVDGEYAFFLAVVVLSRAGVFCVLDAVCADDVIGTDVTIRAAAATDTAIFLKRVVVRMEKLRGIIGTLS